MNYAARTKLSVLVFSFALLIASAIHAKQPDADQQSPAQPPQEQPKPQGPGGAPPGQQPPQELKNIQLLKGMTRPQVVQVMREWQSSLGVECNYCHVRPFEQDTTRKITARIMLRDYVMGMKHKDGSAVSCKDCHNGQATPLRTRPFENAFTGKQGGRQIFKGLSDDKLMEVMNAFTKALGVKCDYCHVQSDFDQDTPRKQIARFMITEFSSKLVKSEGAAAVTCTECHKGRPRPLSDLAPPRPPQEQKPADAKPEVKKPNS
ncbi:MAG TPA: photosynthetic reaction center cytochrome c subunit family protein [Blastocatellia bacterium]|nr:photosynthetic reaction center cytochrome c subunit family protein [Blastocatellia bacterium]